MNYRRWQTAKEREGTRKLASLLAPRVFFISALLLLFLVSFFLLKGYKNLSNNDFLRI